MRSYQIDPTQDDRWVEFVERHPKASVFHRVSWLKALRLTYGYQPVAYTTSSPTDKLENGLVFCQVNSWLTGNRLVSLPFSDHCEPLFDTAESVEFLFCQLQDELNRHEWKFIEVRPVDLNPSQAGDGIRFTPVATHYLHTLDLRPDLDDVFRSLNRDSVQRRIERAQRARLIEISGYSDDLLEDFYSLFTMTRRRHHVPPTPYAWFHNLIGCEGKALEIRVAYKEETPVAAILTLRFRDVVYYKYGCSDDRFKKFAPTPWLLWSAIVAAKSNGATEFDMGRTEDGNAGLLAFKNHWAPHPKRLIYWRFPDSSYSVDSGDSWKMKMARGVFSCMPPKLQTITGELLYRHIG